MLASMLKYASILASVNIYGTGVAVVCCNFTFLKSQTLKTSGLAKSSLHAFHLTNVYLVFIEDLFLRKLACYRLIVGRYLWIESPSLPADLIDSQVAA